MSFLRKIAKHVRNRTLLARIKAAALKSSSSPKVEVPAGNSYYGKTAENYLADRKKKDYWNLEQNLVDQMLAGFPKGIRILDVPFGTGRFVPFYHRGSMEVYGLDASADMLAVAETELGEAYHKCKVQIGDATNLPYSEGYFDLVVCFRFLSHVVSFSQARVILRELHRVTSAKALIQLRVRADEMPKIDPPAEQEPMNDRLTLAQLTSLLEKCGFNVEKVEHLENRKSYFRAIFLCQKMFADSGPK